MTRALMFGDKSGFSRETLERFSACGITHVLCVSGLHFSLILGGLGLALRFLVPGKRARVSVLAAASLMYLYLCGFAVSALRAALMSLFTALSVAEADRRRCTDSLLAAVAVICLISPAAIYDTSLRLSALSCAGICCFSQGVRMFEARFRAHPFACFAAGLAGMSLAAFAFTAPFNACAFGGISLVSVLASAVVVPVAQLCLATAWLSALAAPVHTLTADLFGSVLSRLTEVIFRAAEVFSSLPGAYVEVDAPNAAGPVFFVIFAAAALAARNRARGLKVAFCMMITSFLLGILCFAAEFLR